MKKMILGLFIAVICFGATQEWSPTKRSPSIWVWNGSTLVSPVADSNGILDLVFGTPLTATEIYETGKFYPAGTIWVYDDSTGNFVIPQANSLGQMYFGVNGTLECTTIECTMITPVGTTVEVSGDLKVTGKVSAQTVEVGDPVVLSASGNTLQIQTIGGAAASTTMAGLSADGAVTINDSSADVDFRVESDGNENMLFVDAGNNRFGIGTDSPSTELSLKGQNSATTNGIKLGRGTDDGNQFAHIYNTGGGEGFVLEVEDTSRILAQQVDMIFKATGSDGSRTSITIKGASGVVNFSQLPVHANNAAAIAGGLVAGDLYRTGGDPDPVCVVH